MRRRAAVCGLWPSAEGNDPQEARHEPEPCRGGQAQPPQGERLCVPHRGQDLLDEIGRNRLLVCPIPREQGVGAEEVHIVRHPMRVADNGLEGRWREDGPPRQGDPGHALADIREALGLGQGPDRGMAADALRHAAAPPAPQVLQQCWLTDQPNLEERLLGGGQGHQQRQLLEGLQGQILGLIDEEYHRATLVGLVPEVLLQLGQHGSQSVHLHWDLETVGQQSEELPEGEMRLPEHHRRLLRRYDVRQIRVHHRGFANPRGARDDDKALVGGDPSR